MFPRAEGKQTLLQQRAGMVALHQAGVPYSVIANEHFHCSVNTVKLWCRRHIDSGDVLRKRGSGRPRITTLEEDQRLIDAVRAKPITTAQEILGKLKLIANTISNEIQFPP